MLSSLVRILLFVLTIALGALALDETIGHPELGSYGLPTRAAFAAGAPLRWQISYTPKDTALAAAGVVRGDVVELRSPFEQYRRGNALAGETIEVAIHSGGQTREATLTARPLHSIEARGVLGFLDHVTPAIRLVTQLSMYLLALVLIFRGWNSPAARSLTIFLMAFGYSLALTAPFTLFIGKLLIASHFALNFSIVIALAAVMRFATSFPDSERPEFDPHRIRFWIRRSVPFFAAVMALDTTLEVGSEYFARTYFPLTDTFWWCLWGYALIATLIAMGVGAAHAVGNRRERYVYVTLTFLVGFAGPIASLVGIIAGADYDLVSRLRLSAIVIPIGFSYAMFRLQVFDTTFALNRAVVYTFLSALVLPILALSEWLAEETAKAGNFAGTLGGVIALIAFFVLQNFSEKAERLVDATLFRKRHAMERDVKYVIAELPYIENERDLAQRVVRCLERNLQAHGAAVYAYNGHRFVQLASSFPHAPDAIDDDDDVVLRLRATNESANLVGMETQAPGILALCATKLGPARAIVFCGYRNADQTYTRDDHKLLDELALSFGLAHDYLQIRAIEWTEGQQIEASPVV